jgi:hypothetical protein
MPTASKFTNYAEQKVRGNHNWGTDTFKLFLTNTVPTAGMQKLADVTGHLTTGGGYTGGAGGGVALTTVTVTDNAGSAEVKADQVVVTASGTIGPFRYYGIYNDTQTAPFADGLVLWWDHGSSVTLNAGDSFTVKFSNATNGIIFTDT